MATIPLKQQQMAINKIEEVKKSIASLLRTISLGITHNFNSMNRSQIIESIIDEKLMEITSVRIGQEPLKSSELAYILTEMETRLKCRLIDKSEDLKQESIDTAYAINQLR